MNASRSAHIPTHPPPIRAEAVAVNGGGYQIFTPAEPVRAEPPATATSEPQPPDHAEKRVPDVAVAGAGFDDSEPECPLPPFPLIQWEKRSDRPGWIAQHAPAGAAAPRRTKTYLGYVNKALAAEWLALPEAERRSTIEQWLADRRAQKGVSR